MVRSGKLGLGQAPGISLDQRRPLQKDANSMIGSTHVDPQTDWLPE